MEDVTSPPWHRRMPARAELSYPELWNATMPAEKILFKIESVQKWVTFVEVECDDALSDKENEWLVDDAVVFANSRKAEGELDFELTEVLEAEVAGPIFHGGAGHWQSRGEAPEKAGDVAARRILEAIRNRKPRTR